MRRRRRKRNGAVEDGLELMLDTVANLFGGIVLIAMLVAIMTGEQTHAIAAEGGADDVYEVLRVESVVDAVRRQISEADLEAARQVLEAVSGEDSDEALRSLEGMVVRLEADRKENERALDSRRAVLNKLQSKARDAREMSAGLDDELATLRAIVKARQSELRTSEEIRRPPLVLPKGTLTQAQPLPVVLRYGRLFVPLDRQGRWAEPRSRYREASDGGVEFVPAQSDGVSLDAAFADAPRWRAIQREFPSEHWHFEIAVCPDSYEEFLVLRAAITVAGYQYQIFPWGLDDPIIIEWSSQRSRPVDAIP